MLEAPDLVIFTDGAARGNPGEAGIGVVLRDPQGEVLEEVAEYIGCATNNVAEYTALIRALARAYDRGAREIQIFADSELMVRQLNGQYRVKNAGLQPLYREARQRLARFDRYCIEHVPREQNRRADELANLGIDQFLRESAR